ncbi:MAG: SURF1 family protein [Caulobacteraceae bacterium]|nr:SURF1 family protein [Caulobacteraceae bacterium]
MATSSRPSGRSGGVRQGFPVVMTLFTLAAMALLIGLGVWQVKRLHWKERLLAQIAAAEAGPPEPLAVVLARASDGRDVDYTRVQADCPDIETTPYLRLYAVKDAGAGYRIITACRIEGSAYGSVLVDRGFVAQDDARRLRPGAGQALVQPVVGILRRGDPRTFVTPENLPGQGLWYWRDIPAMAASLGAGRPAPTFLMLQAPAPRGFGPTPAAVPADIPNNHLQYAVTWFGLAAALAGVYLAMLWRRRFP